MSFEERLSNLFDGRRKSERAASAAAQGIGMPPSGGNRLANFLAFPPGTDPTLNNPTNAIQRGISRLPYTVKTVVNNNSPIPVISAKPSRAGSRVLPAQASGRATTRGPVANAGTPSAGLSRMSRVRLAWQRAGEKVRGTLGG